jgi:hypothetical protein
VAAGSVLGRIDLPSRAGMRTGEIALITADTAVKLRIE